MTLAAADAPSAKAPVVPTPVLAREASTIATVRLLPHTFRA
jgi:hypothetical protein